ncbi:MAG TPA: hypothetical protein VE999_05350 [Gemmataceae bacterium]|nr:hypothetical protein [Gemmataceae bacterium]
MKNAHLRFGFAEFEKAHKDAASRIRLIADQFIGEPESGDAHLLSVFGGDSDVGAMAAAIQMNESFLISNPGVLPKWYQLGDRAHLYRGTITVPQRKRPVRHLVAVSSALEAEGNANSIILHRDSPEFMLQRLAIALGLPLLPGWATWLSSQMHSQGRIRRLAGLNCSPVIVTGTKAEFLDWIGVALKAGEIAIPELPTA